MFLCRTCGEVFSNPLTISRKEDLDGEGHWERIRQTVCPWCESPHIGKAEEEDRE